MKGVRVKFYQSTENFTQYQGLRYLLVSSSGKESEWHSLGGTDDFDGAVLSDFTVDCTDSNIFISYTSGNLTESLTINEALEQVRNE